MRLITKVTLGLAFTTLVVTAVSAGLVALLVYPTYEQLDREAAARNGKRAYEILQSEASALNATNKDWAHWDDTYVFADDLNQDYLAGNVKAEDLRNIGVDSLTIVDPAGIVKFHRGYASDSDEHRSLFETGAPLPKELRVAPNSDVSDGRLGFVWFRDKPVIVSATTILTSNKDGTSRGTLLFTRELTPALVERMHQAAQIPFEFTSLGSAPKAENNARELVQADDKLAVELDLNDLQSGQQVRLSVFTDRRFSMIGRDLLFMITGGLFGLGLLSCAVSVLLMARMVTSALGAIVTHMKSISAKRDLGQRLNSSRSDEIGTLSRGLDSMISELEAARNQLQEQSYYGGMADLAAGVLHNVRNALSPLATALWRAEHALQQIKVDRLRQAGEAISSESIADDRRRKFGVYVSTTADSVAAQCVTINTDLAQIRTFSVQIEDILKDHDRISHGPRQTEELDLAPLIEGASRMAVALPGGNEITTRVIPADPEPGRIQAQRIVLAQVLGNIMTNAVEAISRTGRTGGVIEIASRRIDTDDTSRRVEISIRDDGVGMTPDQLNLLFTKGFSTRSGRRGGLGLHWCANSLASMGGRIVAESEGPGRGATFRISLPAAENSMDLAA